MNGKNNSLASGLTLFAALAFGFILYWYALLGLSWIARQCAINALWTVVLSRLAVLGYMLPFIVWLYCQPQKIYTFCLGNTQASIQIPFIWGGINDKVARVSIVFSLLCLALAGIFFCVNHLSFHVLLAGFSFAVLNSILEELLWRSFILCRAIALCGEKAGLILMSLAFGLYHYPLGFSIPICLLFSLGGIYFGGITIRSKGLLLGTAMHISMNLLFATIGIIF